MHLDEERKHRDLNKVHFGIVTDPDTLHPAARREWDLQRMESRWRYNPDYDQDIYDQPTMLVFDDEDEALTADQLARMQEAVRGSLDWSRIGRIMAEDMPGARYMMKKGLQRAFYDPVVQSKLGDFLNILVRTADRRLVTNPETETCEDCGHRL